jgi:hypothetical protein
MEPKVKTEEIQMRFSTLIKRCGIPKWIKMKTRTETNDSFRQSAKERRVVCIHHSETARGAFWAEPTVSCCNVVGHIVFPQPIPGDVHYITGVQQHLYEIRGRQ